MAIELKDLCTPQDYRVGRERFYPSESSLAWTMRRLGSKLRARGAMVVVNGRRMVVPAVFDQVVIDDAVEAAQHAAQIA